MIQRIQSIFLLLSRLSDHAGSNRCGGRVLAANDVPAALRPGLERDFGLSPPSSRPLGDPEHRGNLVRGFAPEENAVIASRTRPFDLHTDHVAKSPAPGKAGDSPRTFHAIAEQ